MVARAAARDEGQRGGVWMQAATGDQTRDSIVSGAALDGERLETQLSARERFKGTQIGADLTSGAAVFGITAGYGDNTVRLKDTGNALNLSGFNVGAYGGWSDGRLFVAALAKADFADAKLDFQSAGTQAQVDVTTFGIQAEAGWRLGGPGFFAEPMVSVSWTTSEIDDVEVAQGSFAFGDGANVRGKAGMRVGGAWDLSDDLGLQPSLGLFAIRDFAGEDGLRFRSGPATLAVDGAQAYTYGRLEGGLTLTGAGGLDTFVKGEADFAGDVSGMAVRAGFSWRW